MHWLVDNAFWFYGLLILAALVLGLLWWVHRRREFLIALAVVGAVALALWFLCRLVVTDRQQLVNNITEMADAVVDHRPDDVVKHLAENFDFPALNRTVTKSQVRDAIKSAVEHYGIDGIRVWDFKVTEVSRSDGRAKVEFFCRVSLSSGGDQMFLCRSRFILENGNWRMKAIDFYNPIVKTDQPVQFNLP
jgi:hypothetical protein